MTYEEIRNWKPDASYIRDDEETSSLKTLPVSDYEATRLVKGDIKNVAALLARMTKE